MPDITIPDAAVEAAAQVYFGEYGPSNRWHSPSMSEEERDRWRDEVTAYLAAAAPHIAAQALDDLLRDAPPNGRPPRPFASWREWIAYRALRLREPIEADHG